MPQNSHFLTSGCVALGYAKGERGVMEVSPTTKLLVASNILASDQVRVAWASPANMSKKWYRSEIGGRFVDHMTPSTTAMKTSKPHGLS